jgi:hypothetical protein
MANFKPHTKTMFKRLIEEVWHLRSGIEYSEKGKNYYMITLFSRGDYDFVKRGGPWIFNQHALIVTDLDESLQPSETDLNAVPVWVRIYDVPWGKQNETWGYRYGDGLGKTLEVDVPASEQQKKEFFRVRVNLPYDRRLQTRIIAGVKGRPQEAKIFKLKYERVPYYCSHCGFMGHKKDDCEKRRVGTPSLDYDAHELRCSPYKKFEHRTYYVPPAAQVKRGLSFSSFGSAGSFKHFDQNVTMMRRRSSMTPDYVPSQVDSVDENVDEDNSMPPLMEDPLQDGVVPEEADGSMQAEVESSLVAQVDAMLVTAEMGAQTNQSERDASKPIIQFPDEDGHEADAAQNQHTHIGMTADMLAHVYRMQVQQGAGSGSSSWPRGPRSSDMIPALHGLSDLQVSFGSASDVAMYPADTILGKRNAEEPEVQGDRLDMARGRDDDGQREGGTSKKGKIQGSAHGQGERREVELFYRRNRKQTATGQKPSGNLTRPNVWSRQGQ